MRPFAIKFEVETNAAGHHFQECVEVLTKYSLSLSLSLTTNRHSEPHKSFESSRSYHPTLSITSKNILNLFLLVFPTAYSSHARAISFRRFFA